MAGEENQPLDRATWSCGIIEDNGVKKPAVNIDDLPVEGVIISPFLKVVLYIVAIGGAIGFIVLLFLNRSEE